MNLNPAELSDSLDLPALGIDPSEVESVVLLRRREGEQGHAVYRVFCSGGTHGRTFVLKRFLSAESTELRAYALLSDYRVPTIPVHGKTGNALLLEDLNTSVEWRLASAEDNIRGEVGVAVAEWYAALHSAGRRLILDCGGAPAYLRREADTLDAHSALWMGERLGDRENPVWRFTAEHIEELKGAIRALPTTLNYNDFAWTNLALSRQERPALRAIVFDYHLLGIGPAYSDYRNVVTSLEEPARRAFIEAFGPIDEREATLDAPVSVLYSLYEALRRPQLPGWATSMIAQSTSGELERKLRQAVAILTTPPSNNRYQL